MKEESVFSRGLEDVIAGESSICQIDGHNSKLFYRGYAIHDLAENSNFEETAYLLLFGKLPTVKELDEFNQQLASERFLHPDVIKLIENFPKNIHPMAALRTSVSFLSNYDDEAESKATDANIRKAIRLIAKTPLIVAAIDRIRKNLPVVEAKKDPKVNTAANFLYMLKGKEATPVEIRMLDKYFILLAEHDYNASTFAAMTVASTTSDMYSAMVAGVGTLKGDLHGSANSRAMESIIAIGDVSNVTDYVEKAFANKQKFMGFGHRVYKGPDPRAYDLKIMAKTLAENNPEQAKWYAISEALEKAVYDRKKLSCNVDFYSASVLYTVGIPVDLFTLMFAISRMAGWTAHVLEQNANNRLIRPVSIYTGKTDQKVIPIQNRS